jgi:hypothetical protein
MPKIISKGYSYQFCSDIDTLRQKGAGTSINTNSCFYEVGLNTLNLDACNRITGDEASKEDCITRVQHATG